MDNIEKFKGQTDGIILYILQSGDRHTDELKDIIDTLFSEVKIGTLYSVIARLKTQQLISEYRASSSNGSRRKYYKITNKGVNEFNSKYATLFVDSLPVPKREETTVESYVKPVKDKSTKAKTTDVQQNLTADEDDYSSYIKSAEHVSDDIDFTSFEEETIVVPQKTQFEEDKNVVKISTKQEIDTFTVDDYNLKKDMEKAKKDDITPSPIDNDSIGNREYQYNLALKELFPKNIEDNDDTQEDVKEKTITTTENPSDFSKIYELAEKDGIKIRTSSDTNRYQGSKILINTLRLHTSLVVLALYILQFITISIIFSAYMTFDFSLLLKTSLLVSVVAIISLIIYLLDRKKSIKDMFKFKNVIEIALTLMIATIIIAVSVAFLKDLDYNNFKIMFDNVILPILISINIPLFFIIEHLLCKLDFYQVI